jgi:hypothetical protein
MIAGMRLQAFESPLLCCRARPARLLAPAAAVAALLCGCSAFHTVPATPVVQHRAELPTDTGLPAAAVRALGQRFAWMHPVVHSSGRLQVDDADDLAVVLAPTGQSNDSIVAVLVTGAGGEYRVATASKVIAPGCEPCTTTVDIARHVLSVHVMRPSDPDFERVTYQFGYRNSDDALRLIGVTAAQPAGDDPIAHSYAISTNLLNGAKVDALDAGQSDPARRRELRSSVPLRPAIAFDAFSFAPGALGPELRRLPASAFEPADALPAAAATLLRSRFPGTTVQARSAGPLRTDGARDLAVVLAPAGSAAADGDATLALLLAQPDGSLRLGATSGSLTRSCRGCDVQVQIAHRALVVQTTGTDSSGTRIVGYQFMPTPKDKAGALRLVGVRTVLATRSGGGDSHRYVNTTNLLTGDKLDVVEDTAHGHRRRVERASRVPVRPAIALAGFAFDPSRLDTETRRDFTP